MNVPRCRHIKTNGLVCKSPALQGNTTCFFHYKQHRSHAFTRSTNRPYGAASAQQLPPIRIEDSDSIQLALSVVINGLALGVVDPDRARVLLYGLQIASTNAKLTVIEPAHSADVVRTTDDLHGEDEAMAIEGDQVQISEFIVDTYDDDEEDEDDEEEDDDEDYED